MDTSEILHSRELGQFPISIGTSLSLESLMNIHPDIKHTKAPISSFNELWINVRTLFRNLYSSMPRQSAEQLPPKDFARILFDEMKFLIEWGNDKSVSTPVLFYYSRYADLARLYPKAVFREVNTQIQMTQVRKQKDSIDILFKNSAIDILDEKKQIKQPLSIRAYKNFIRAIGQPNVAMMTHYAFDLLKLYSFSNLILIESHTGKIKTRAEWYTKYAANKDLPPLPFTVELMHVFGDKEIFKQMPIGMRKYILDLAKEYQWTPMTTKDRMIQSIEYSKHPEFAHVFRSIFGKDK